MQLPGANPGLADVWATSEYTADDRRLWMQAGLSPGEVGARYGVQRDAAKRLTRTLYHTPNPIFQAAVNLMAAFLVGDAFSYGEHSDKAVRDTVEEFWQTNALGEYVTTRAIIEYLLDGELAMVWNKDSRPELPARVAALDTALNLTVTGNPARGLVAADMAERLTVNKGQTNEQNWNEGEFVWMASAALLNDVRGWPPTLAAAMAAVGFVSLVNSRLRANDLLGRLLAIYKAFLDPDGENASGEKDGGLSGWLAKARAFKNVPEDGAVVPLVVKPGHSVTETVNGQQVTTKFDGVTESLEFPNASPGAGDAASDLRVLMRLVGTALGLPEHFLGEGGNANRATASEMTLPAVMICKRHQAFLRAYLDRVIRTELVRRHGPDRLYTVYEMVPSPDGLSRKRRRKRVPAQLIEVPWILPSITQHSLDELISLAEAAERHGWASSQTLSGTLGFDTPAEAELMAATGRTFGQPAGTGGSNAQTTPTPQPGTGGTEPQNAGTPGTGEKPPA